MEITSITGSIGVVLARAVFMSGFFLLPLVRVQADIVTFEDLPNQYLFTGGGTNIGSFYAGITFGPNVTGIDLSGSTAFPPHSGSIVAWDPTDDPVTITFTNPQSMVGLWYTSLDPLTLNAFNSSGNLLDSTIGLANTDGTTGESDFLLFTDPNIASVTLSSTPGNYVFDDVTFSPGTNSPLPEPSFAVLIGFALGAFVCLKNRSNRSRPISKR